jgi:hypothetical protein
MSESSVELVRERILKHKAPQLRRDQFETTLPCSRLANAVHLQNRDPLIFEDIEGCRKRNDSQKDMFHLSNFRSQKSELGSDSSTSSLEDVLDPVKSSSTAGNRAIEVFMDGLSDSSETEYDISSSKEDESLRSQGASAVLSAMLGSSVDNSTIDIESQFKKHDDVTLFRGNYSTVEYFGQNDEDRDILPIVTPTSSSAHPENNLYEQAPFDEQSKMEQNCDLFEETSMLYPDDETSMLYRRNQITHLQAKQNSTANSGYTSSGSNDYVPSVGLTFIDSEDYDPVFLEKIVKERRLVKRVAKKLHEGKQSPATMES